VIEWPRDRQAVAAALVELRWMPRLVPVDAIEASGDIRFLTRASPPLRILPIAEAGLAKFREGFRFRKLILCSILP
jgi:hypothetical protein